MKFALASYGTRGDVEPCVAVTRELLRRGHEVRIAVPPDLVSFAESAGFAAVPYGPDARRFQDAHRDFLANLFRKPWKVRDLLRLWGKDWALFTQFWKETSTTLMALADGVDLLFTGVLGEQAAANIAEYYGIPLATLHTYPMRANGQLATFLPTPVGRSVVTMSEWLEMPLTKKLADAQRRELGLPKAKGLPSRRITERGSLEIQAYDEVCFPGLAAEWARFDSQRPFVGALTVESTTDTDDEVASWIAAGTPPIFFGFGSMPVASPVDTLAMISAACAELGERALVCAGGTDFARAPHFEHVKVVSAMNYAAAFPACRAVVHHGGAGTAAASLRAGVPALILPTWPDQTLWGTVVKRLGVGTFRRFSTTTQQTLVADLRTILAPQYVARAREVATQMTTPAESVAAAADRVENYARLRTVG
ncbi:glycosyltransferase [Mycobacterium xenopi]|uniref:Glycosyltransferase/ rhamnosyltransferase n=1 Tax=Mycobacterium xenopi TaxID=1789 RepID=A0AAD1LZF6_MYCXE|nr:glycosyltransferase [Mycobacterium xenopi]MDA3642083.1 glycosyltransferase [Mycobacterium xenopi]MDA3659968.1 glycosyltransferase [Mycobacterium xenopi]MDA3664232.1 glycosyltransferase [Mycobacterium xenopi]ORX19937.1 glycosyl transferase family 1 [Mycobacterium xenopi]SPX79721.1 glycosyltransferase [Mycobacterium xenopi]